MPERFRRFGGGRAGSQAGSQSLIRSGPSLRGASIKRRTPTMGTQERGSQTDQLTRVHRTSTSMPSFDFPVLKQGGPPASGGTPANQGTQPEQPSADGGEAPITDPNALDREITPENTLRRQRLGFDVGGASANTGQLNSIISQLRKKVEAGESPSAQSAFLDKLKSQVLEDIQGGLNRESLIRRQFESQLPFLNETFRDQAQGITERTAAMGRTGSGMVDRDFAELENQQELKRRGLLGQITSRAAGQAIQDRLGLLGQGQGLAQTQLARERAAFRDPLSALGQAGQLALGGGRLGLQAQQINQQRDLARQAHLRQQQSREDRLARQAMQDRAMQMRFMQRGFQSPRAYLQAQQALGGQQGIAASQFGANAGQIGRQLGGLGRAGANLMGGPQSRQSTQIPRTISPPPVSVPGSGGGEGIPFSQPVPEGPSAGNLIRDRFRRGAG